MIILNQSNIIYFTQNHRFYARINLFYKWCKDLVILVELWLVVWLLVGEDMVKRGIFGTLLKFGHALDLRPRFEKRGLWT